MRVRLLERAEYGPGMADRAEQGRLPQAATRSDRLRRYLPVLQTVLLVAVAGVADYLTGPELTAAAFYIAAVILGAWRMGWKAGVATAVAATALDFATEWLHASRRPSDILLIESLFAFITFLVIARLAAVLSQQHRVLSAQRDELAGLNGQMNEEMRAARMLQSLLMSPPPEHPRAEIATYGQTARVLGGDAADLSLSPDGCLAVAVADVSGKGSPAALAGAVLLGLLADAPERHHSPADTLRRLNEQLVERLPDTMFVTFFYALLDLEEGELTYASAGHDPPFLIRASGEIRELDCTGMVLGGLAGTEYTERKEPLTPGDVLFCYTDGITDFRSGSGARVGPDRLRELVIKHANEPCVQLVASIVNGATGRAEDVPDDITLVAIRYRGADVATSCE